MVKPDGKAVKLVAVIGSGIGGSAVAALLARKGHQVTVFEKNEFIGGKCASFVKDSFTCDLGVHMFGNCERGPLGRIASMTGARITWKHAHPLGVFHCGTAFPVPQEMDMLGNAYLLMRKLRISLRKTYGAARFMNTIAAAGDERAEALDRVPLRDFLLRYTDDEAIHRFTAAMTMLAFVLPYQEASTGEYIKVYSEALGNRSLGYPVGGAQAVPRAYLAALEEMGGRVMLANEVRQVVVDDGRVVGVVADAAYEVDAVVSNVGIKRTVELAGAGSFPDEYVKYVGALRESYGGASIKYALSKKVLDMNMFRFVPQRHPLEMFDFFHEPDRVPEDPDIFMPVPSNLDPSLVPPGCQLAIAGTALPAGLDREEQCERILDNLDAKVSYLFPGVEKHLLFSIRTNTRQIALVSGRPTGEAVGIAQSFDQVGGRKLEVETPVKGLFLVGADTGGRGIGTEAAANSALACSAAVG